jgi:hypothetical protein
VRSSAQRSKPDAGKSGDWIGFREVAICHRDRF